MLSATLARFAPMTGLGPIAMPTGILASASGNGGQKRREVNGASRIDPEEP